MPKRPITPEDLYRIVTLEDPKLSPDGQWIAFTRAQPNAFHNNYVRNIWVVPVAGGDPIQITRGDKDSSPSWSPDGIMLAFQSGRGTDGKAQIYVIPVTAPGGDARQITRMLNGATQPSWSSDSKTLAFLSAASADERAREDQNRDEKRDPPKDKLDIKHRAERREEDDKGRLDPYPAWRIPYRAGTTFSGERYAQIYTVDTSEADPLPRRRTHREANHEPPLWSPDGQFIYTARQVDPSTDEPNRTSALFKIRAVDGQTVMLTDASMTSFTPVPSPDGKWVAFTHYPRDGAFPVTERLTHLAVIDAEGSTPVRDLSTTLDVSAHFLAWTPDNEIVFSSSWHGDGPIFAVTPDGTTRTVIDGRFRATFLNADAGGVVYVASTPECPPELFYLPHGGSMRQLTHFNQPFLDDVIIQPTHTRWYESDAGVKIQGWYLLPVGYQAGQKMPLALNIHGGPHVMWATGEASMFHEWQLHAARGYVVFCCNPRGSDGYGEAFMQGVHEDWGDTAMRDIMTGVDLMIADGIVDPDRMAITGGSYGGYMVAWILGHSDRFKAAVAQRGVYNLLSFYGTTDVPSLISGEFGAEPWEDSQKLWRHSPLAYAHLIKTPLLIEHAEQDYRVPIEQAEQLFAYVHRTGGIVKLLRYPREGHEKSRSGEPAHRVDRLHHMVDWFDIYCRSKPSI